MTSGSPPSTEPNDSRWPFVTATEVRRGAAGGTLRGATLALAALLAAVGPPVHASPPLSGAAVQARLERLIAAPESADAEARWLLLEPALDALPPGVARALLTSLASQGRAPVVAMRARLASPRYEPEIGSARRAAAALGFIDGWLAAGPTPMVPGEIGEAHRELRAAPAPAVGHALGDTTWRWLTRAGPPGAVSVEHLLPDEAPAAVHLVTWFRLARATDVTLRLGGSGQLAASVDGVASAAVHDLAFAVPDQLSISSPLAAGWHVLALSVAREAGGRALVYARLTDRAGRALPVRLWAPGDEAGSWPPLTDSGVDLPQLDRGPALLSRALDLGTRVLRAAARRALGIADLETADGDGDLLEELLLEPEAARMPAVDLLLALEQVRREEARASILLHRETFAELGAEEKLAQADLASSRGQHVRARALLDSAVGGPPDARAVVAARLARRVGLPSEGYARVNAADLAPSERLLAERATLAAAMSRPDLAEPALKALRSGLPGDATHAAAMAETLVSLQRSDEALQLYATLEALRPDVPGYALQSGRLKLARGDGAGARAVANAVAAASEVDASALAAAAQLVEDSGDAEAAAELWRRALTLKPGDPDLRAAADRTAPRGDERLPFELDLLRDLAPLSSQADSGVFEILGDELHLDVKADGGYVRYQSRVLRVLRVPDSRDARTFTVAFDPTQEDVRVLSARVYRDGLALTVPERETQQLSESWYGMYYDMRALSVPFDDLRPGDLVEIRHRIDGAPSRAMPGTFSLLEALSERMPKRRLALSITAPASLGLRSRLEDASIAGAPATTVRRDEVKLPDGRVRVTIHIDDLPALPAERGQPAPAELGLVWQVSSFTSWNDLASRYRRLIEPQRIVTPAMRRWVEERVAKATSVEAGLSRPRLVRSLVDGLTAEIRYVGLEFGVHGFKPYRTDQVWARRFGDCKDQATLMTTLLRVAGISAHVVLVRTRPRGRVADPLPSLALFDHAIVYLDDDARFVDPTARWVGLGELPDGDQGAQALVLTPDTSAAAPALIPPDPPARNGLEGFFTVVLATDGSGHLEGESTFRGVQAATYRAQLADVDARAERLSRMMNGRYPGFVLSSYEVSDPLDRSNPLRFTFVGDVPRVAEQIGDTLQVARPAGGDGHAARLAGDARRRSPLVLGAPVTLRSRFRYVMPVGFTAVEIPSSGAEQSAFGSWSVLWESEPGEVRASSELVLAVDQVLPDAYPAFREFMQRFDQAVRPPLVLRREAPKTAAVLP